jgi:hypothetical protein
MALVTFTLWVLTIYGAITGAVLVWLFRRAPTQVLPGFHKNKYIA